MGASGVGFAAPVEGARLPRWLPATAVAVALVLVITIGGYLVLSRVQGHERAELTPLPAPAAPVHAVVPTWPPGHPAGGGVVVTRQMAEDVVARWWPAHSLALRDGDLAVLTQLTGGAGRRGRWAPSPAGA